MQGGPAGNGLGPTPSRGTDLVVGAAAGDHLRRHLVAGQLGAVGRLPRRSGRAARRRRSHHRPLRHGNQKKR